MCFCIKLPHVDLSVSFSKSTYRVHEGTRLVQPELVLTNQSSTDITVRVFSTDKTAIGEYWAIAWSLIYYYCIHLTGGADYTSGPYSVTIPAGVISVSFRVAINDDNVGEEDEQFSLTIDPSSLPANVPRITPGVATFTIVDDDGMLINNDHNQSYLWNFYQISVVSCLNLQSVVFNGFTKIHSTLYY